MKFFLFINAAMASMFWSTASGRLMSSAEEDNSNNISLQEHIETNIAVVKKTLDDDHHHRLLQSYPTVATGGPDEGCAAPLGMNVFPYDDTANIRWPTEIGNCRGIDDPHTTSCVKTVTAPPFTIWVKLPLIDTSEGSQLITADTERSGFDTRLQIYQGTTCTSLTCVTVNDDADASSIVSKLSWEGLPNVQYWLKIDDAPCAMWNSFNSGDNIPLGLRIVKEPYVVEATPDPTLPVTSTPTPAPVTSSPTMAPVTSAPTPAPITSSPTPAPVTPEPTVTPVTTSPTTQAVPDSSSSSSTSTNPPCNICSGDDTTDNTIGKLDGVVTIPDPEDPTSTRTVTCETLQSLANDLSFSAGLCMLTFDSTYEDCECRTSNGNLISSSGGEAGGLSVNGDSDGGDADGLVGSGGSYYGLVVESSSFMKLTGMLLIIQFTVVWLG